jgi:hypothetical protein
MSEKKQWSELSPGQRRLIIAGGAAEVCLTAICIVDLVRRDRSQVRGPKPLWVASFVIQPLGPLAYLVVGRR